MTLQYVCNYVTSLEGKTDFYEKLVGEYHLGVGDTWWMYIFMNIFFSLIDVMVICYDGSINILDI